MTRNINIGPDRYNVWNEYNLKTLTRNNWRASLVPAAAVIPAPIVYMKVAAVKKLVVGFRIVHVLQSTIFGAYWTWISFSSARTWFLESHRPLHFFGFGEG